MEKRERILLIGDSLGFARPAHGQTFDQAWPEIIKRQLPQFDIWQRCRPTATVLDVNAEFGLFSHFADQFQSFVIQVGITDCCPRPFPFWMQRVIRTYAGSDLQRWIGKRYPLLLKFRSQPWIPKKRYESTLSAMIDQINKVNPHASIGIIVIADAGNKLIDRVAGIQEAIDEYNRLLADIEHRYQGKVSLINPFLDEDSLLLPDGHHLTVKGHAAVARAVVAFLEKGSDRVSDSAKVSSVSSTALQ